MFRSPLLLLGSFLAVVFLLVFQSADALGGEKISLAAGPAPLKSIVEKIKESFEKDTGIAIELYSGGSLSGINTLIAIDTERAEVGLTGADWESLVAVTAQKGHVFKSRELLRNKVISSEPTYFITNLAGAKTLTDEQLSKIFSGKVTDWKELGEKPAPIMVAIPEKFPATKQMIIEKFLKGETLRPGIKYVNTFEDIVDFVAANPGAIGVGSPAIISPRVQHPKHPSMDRPTQFITRGEPTGKVLRLLEHIEKFLASQAKK